MWTTIGCLLLFGDMVCVLARLIHGSTGFLTPLFFLVAAGDRKEERKREHPPRAGGYQDRPDAGAGSPEAGGCRRDLRMGI